MIPRHLADATLHNGTTRKARLHLHACGTWTLIGLDDPRCAGEARVDLQPLTPLGEALALLNQRPTYQLTRRAGRLELDSRHQWAIAAHAAGTGPFDVLATHICGQTPTQTTTTNLPTPRTQETHDEPPY